MRSQRITWQKKSPKLLWLLQDICISLAQEGKAGALPEITLFLHPQTEEEFPLTVCLKYSWKTNIFLKPNKDKTNQERQHRDCRDGNRCQSDQTHQLPII